MALKIKIHRNYTLPHNREGDGRSGTETLAYPEDGRTPEEWAAGALRDAGCTRYNSDAQYYTEEPKITDYSRGEEMTAMGALHGFTEGQLQEVFRLMSDG